MTTPSKVPMRTCKECRVEKPLTEFVRVYPPAKVLEKHPDWAGKWYQHRCMACYNEYHVEWRKKQGDKYRKYTRNRFHEQLAKMPEKERLEYYAQKAAGKRERNAKVKDEVYRAYGGYRCVCCGETIPEFLTIDHINNDGAAHRKAITSKGRSSSDALLHWLKRNGYPKGFQILCWNCQWGKQKCGGICPHQKMRNDYPERE
jgi:hypothetical protein